MMQDSGASVRPPRISETSVSNPAVSRFASLETPVTAASPAVSRFASLETPVTASPAVSKLSSLRSYGSAGSGSGRGSLTSNTGSGNRLSVSGQDASRRIEFGVAHRSKTKFVSNYVSTTKYEIWNIVPKNLFEQFRRVANFWFLTVSAFQMAPLELSPTNKYATLFPLCCVLFLTFCKDCVEDWRRRRDDHRVNNQICTLVDCADEPCLRDVRWKDVPVGVCLRLIRDSPIPADMILLSCSNEDGLAYVDTAQLDGETTLKPKFAVEQTMHIDDLEGLAALEGRVETELPNEWVQSFSGVLNLKGRPRACPLDLRSFLLRGSTLRNTQWAFGLTVFTGVDTKLVRNSKKTPSKRSRVEVITNRLLSIVFTILCIAALASAISRAVYSRGSYSARLSWVWPETDDMKDSSYLSFITFMIGFNNFIPISLYVTMDMVRTFQAAFMERDESMYHQKTGSHCKVKNSNLCENLGQIEFVLSDKTGTLTENEMQFKALAIAGRSYGQWDDHLGPVSHVVNHLPSHICQSLVDPACPSNMSSPTNKSSPRWTKTPSSSTSSALGSTGTAHWSEEEETIDDFFKCLSLCHTAIPEQNDLPQDMPDNSETVPGGTLSAGTVSAGTGSDALRLLREEAGRTVYKSPSPDEEALLAAARDNGYFFRRKGASEITVNIRGSDESYGVAICNAFTSERKRMSVLITQDDQKDSRTPTLEKVGISLESSPRTPSLEKIDDIRSNEPGRYILYAKGADNIMFGRLSQRSRQQTQDMNVHRHLERFASCGLRTLVLAKREVSKEQAEDFLQQMAEAKNALMNRNELMEVVAESMEQELEFLGITAIEDKIQKGVPETVDMLLRAGIKVWVLTGDKMETAMNFGMACKLISRDMTWYVLDASDDGERVDVDKVTQQLEQYYMDILTQKKCEKRQGDFQYCLIAHGQVLYTVMSDAHPILRHLFIAIACSSHSVLACRLAPAQKGALVRLVRSCIVGYPLTLSIGDGANDVSMIQEAHVGVGILGVEGRQAANSADFAIGQFRFLQQLLFIHGRWNLRRVGIVIGYSFYKNFLLVLPMVYFTYQSGFSGTTLYDSYLLTVYNLVFTSLPILVMGVFDSDVAPWLSLAVPGLYQAGVDGRYFNPCMFIGWIARGAFHSMVTFTFMLILFGYEFGDGQINLSGQTPDLLVMGSWVYWTCVVIVNFKLLFHMKAWMDWEVFMVVASALVFLPWLAIYSTSSAAGMFNMDMVGVGPYLFRSPTCWLGLILVVAIAVFTDLALRFARKTFAPDPVDILMEVQLGHCPRKLLVNKEQSKRQDRADHAGEFVGIQAMVENGPSPRPAADKNARLIRPEVESSVWKIPSPKPRVHRIRELAGCRLVPLELDRISGQGHCCRRCRPARRRRHRRWKNQVADAPSTCTAISEYQSTPVPPIVEGVERLSFDSEDDQSRCWWKPACLRGICHKLLELRYYLEEMQWCEMVVAGQGAEKNQEILSSMNAVLRNQTQGQAQAMAERMTGNASEQSSSAAGTLSRRTDYMWSKKAMAIDEDEAVTRKSVEFVYSAFTLRFLSHTQESKFRAYLSAHTIRLSKKSFPMFFVIVSSFKLLDFLLDHAAKTAGEVIFSIALLVFCSGIIPFQFTRVYARRVETFIQLFCVFAIPVKHMLDIASGDSGILTTSFIPICVIGGSCISFVPAVAILCFHLVCILVRYSVFFEKDSQMSGLRSTHTGVDILLEQFVLQLGITCLSLLRAYRLEICMREEFIMQDNFRDSQAEVFNVLCYMFPDAIATQLISHFREKRKQEREILTMGKPTLTKTASDISTISAVTSLNKMQTEMQSICYDRGIVTVVFCDIYDFESLLENLSPTELVKLLDSLWKNFDTMCERHNLVKIETVGKTYMACAMSASVTDEKSIKHISDATRAVLVAIDMLELAKKRVLGLGRVTKVAIRIGMHSGRTSSGVVGSKKPQYALFGDTVNTAARMQSTGQRNHLHISRATFRLVRGDTRFSWEARMTPAKGKGVMDTYLLTSYRIGQTTDKANPANLMSHTASSASMFSTVKRVASTNSDPAHNGISNAPLSKGRGLGLEQVGTHSTNSKFFAMARTSESNTSHANTDGGRRSAPLADFMGFVRSDKSHIGKLQSLITGSVTPSVNSPTSSPDLLRSDESSEEDLSAGLDPETMRHIADKLGYTLCFSPEDIENEYRNIRKRDVRPLWISFLYFWSLYIAVSLVVILDNYYHNPRPDGHEVRKLRWLVAARVAYIVLTLPLACLICKDGSDRASAIVHVVFIGFLVSLASVALCVPNGFNFAYVVEVYFFITNLAQNCGLLFVQCIYWLTACVVVSLVVAFLKWGEEQNGEWFIEIIVSLLVLQVLQVVALYFAERRDRLTFVLILAVREEQEELNHLLDSMLPPEVLLELKAGSVRDAYLYNEMTILFSDIVDFTAYCAGHTVEESVSLVTKLFSEIDKFTVILGIYKVCTIGDAYVVVNQPRARSVSKYGDCVRVLIMAMWMLTVIKKVREEVRHETLDMRIGIHCGSFVGGVIGTKRLRFDVWGPDVLAANLVEQHGLAGCVVVSLQAKSMLQHWRSNFFEFLPHKAITLRSGGSLNTYVCRRPISYGIGNGGGNRGGSEFNPDVFSEPKMVEDILDNLSCATGED